MNKHTITYPFVGLLFAFLVGSCTSGTRALKQGDYYEAVLKAADRLRKSPDNEKAQEVLRNAYPLAVAYYTDVIERTQRSEQPFMWSATADAYRDLNRMYETILHSPGARSIIPEPRAYGEEQAQADHRAAAEQYRAGEDALAEHSRAEAREAYFRFQQADEYVPNYQDIKQRIAEARNQATLVVVIDRPPSVPRAPEVRPDRFYEQVEDYLQERQDPFIRFYTPQEAQALNVGTPDQIIQLQFSDFVIGQTHTFQREESVVSADSVYVGDITTEEHGKQPIYGLVSAQLTTTQIEMTSTASLRLKVREGHSPLILYRDTMREQHHWTNEWATYQGDERALTAVERVLCEALPARPPSADDLFAFVTAPIYDQLTYQIDQFYEQYE